MHEISATCPLCQATRQYGAELIGRYTLCPACRGRFYIEVPPLGQPTTTAKLRLQISPGSVPTSSTTLDDLLWDTQRGNRFVIQSLRRIESRLSRQGYGIAVLLVLLLVITMTLFGR